MKVCLFVAVALLTLASSEVAQGVTIPINLNLGPSGTLAADTTISFSNLNGTALMGQPLSVNFVFTNMEFVRLFTVTTDFSVSMTLQTSGSISSSVFLNGTGFLTDSLGNALEPPETLGRANSSNSLSVALLPTVGRPIDFYGVHLDLTFPTNPAVVTGGEFRLLSNIGQFGIGPGLPADIVPDTGGTAILLGLGFFGIALAAQCLDRSARRYY